MLRLQSPCSMWGAPPCAKDRMVGILVTSAGLLLSNAEYLWIRSHTSQDEVHVAVGSLVEAVPQSSDRWLHFGRSSCAQWDSGMHGCLSSELQVELLRGVECDIFAWAEAADRREPVRARIVVAQGWTYGAPSAKGCRRVPRLLSTHLVRCPPRRPGGRGLCGQGCRSPTP